MKRRSKNIRPPVPGFCANFPKLNRSLSARGNSHRMRLRHLSGLTALMVLRIGAFAATLTIELPANSPVETTIDSSIDDSNLRDPRGYRHHGSASRIFQRQLTLTNTGITSLTG